MKIANLQYQFPNGKWENCADRTDEFLAKCVAFGFDAHDEETAISQLATGRALSYGADWYAKIRILPKLVATPKPRMVKCSCGHTVSRIMVMSSSRGSSCPDCYDRMSG